MIATAIRDAKKDKEYYDDGNLETGNFIVKSVRLLLDYKQSMAARTSFRGELWPDFKTKYEALGSTITLIDYEEMDLTVASTTSKAT